MNKIYTLLLTGFLVTSFICLSASVTFGQQDKEKKIKFGQVDESEVRMKVYDKDSSAVAVVLYDRGESYFAMDNGFYLVHERHRKIKILSKEGYKWADHEVFYINSQGEESVSAIKGNTYVLEGDQVVKYKMENKAVFTEKITQHLHRKKFTLPNVKEGAVIEYSYRISTGFWETFQPWKFQDEIPVVWSEYTADIPEYVTFRQSRQQIDTLFIDERKKCGPGLDPTNTCYRWVARDVPAFRKEAFIASEENHIAKIEFQLVGYQLPYQAYKPYSESWMSITRNLLEYESFGQQLKKNMLKEMPTLASAVNEQKEADKKMLAIYDYLKQNIQYNGQERIYTSKEFSKTIETKTGNVADINLLLVTLLRNAGLSADPVVLSTRENGKIRYWYPSDSQVDYVVACVNLDGKLTLLDATDENQPIGLLPIACLNGQGWVVSEKDSRWIDISNTVKTSRTFFALIDLNEDGMIKGTVQAKSDGYFAWNARNEITGEGEERYVKKDFKSESSNINIGKFTIERTKEIAQPLKSSIEINAPEYAQAANSRIYLNPLLPQVVIDNPFKSKERRLPVDFPHPWEETYTMSLVIPAGYQVETVPQNLSLVLPEKGASFMYSISIIEGKIQMVMKFAMNKTFFSAEEYGALHEFYAQMIAKQAEQIVLKKN